VGPHTYEITFAGHAGPALCAEFDDCEVTMGADTTTLRANLPDQGALWGILERIIGLGLQLIDLHLVAPGGTSADSDYAGRAARPVQTGYQGDPQSRMRGRGEVETGRNSTRAG
jgi:hypothetical protein